LAAGIVTLASGRLSDQVRHSDQIIVFGYLMMATGFFLLQFIGSVYQLFAIQMLIGIGEAIYSPAFDKLYSDHLTPTKSGTEWGAWESMYYFTTAFGAFLGGLVVTNFGFSVLFAAMAMLCALSGGYLYRLSPRRVL
ncbi:MAG: MFS transporter, partial [Candidatus Peregrinibacteria bacterium]|nr:MFS transporter [Candidatus Peregrinibacteria bacterium]